jgi:hypothetical protein
MRRLRISVMLSMVCLGLWLMATPVFANPGQNPGQKGQNCPSGQGCPHSLNLSTSSLTLVHSLGAHPLVALTLVAACICVIALRQRTLRRVTE